MPGAISKAALSSKKLDKSFETWWPELRDKLRKI